MEAIDYVTVRSILLVLAIIHLLVPVVKGLYVLRRAIEKLLSQ